jgi:hypothetical protein
MGSDTLFLEHITKAKEMYLKGQRMVFHYTEPIDRVYLKEIEEAKMMQKKHDK